MQVIRNVFHRPIDANECEERNGGCANGATCINNLGSYTCSCAEGWAGAYCTYSKFLSIYCLTDFAFHR